MSNYQNAPVKLYIQDIFRAKTTEQRYIYELFNLTFKNVMIHGVVTSIYNRTATTTNLELSDPTGSVQIFYDTGKSNMNTRANTIQDLYSHLADVSRNADENLGIISTLMDSIISKRGINFDEGDYLSVVGDIFFDKNCRLVSAYECKTTSLERDVIWLEELRYLYEKFYLWDKV